MKRSIWVWYCDQTHGGFLFRGNPNPQENTPPYHLGGICNLVNGETIVYAGTLAALKMESGITEWNIRFPQFRVKPKSIMVEIRPYYKRKNKGGEE